MIQFNKRCEICGKPTSDTYANEIDGHVVCLTHFRMLLEAGLLFEGMDDMWHFVVTNKQDVEEIIKILK